MNDTAKCTVLDLEKKAERATGNRCKEKVVKVKDKPETDDLPSPPPDPWVSSRCMDHVRGAQEQSVETPRPRSLGEEEDIIAYLTDLGTPPYEGQTSECPSRNSATSNMAVSSLCAEEAFEHLDRLYNLAEQILDLRNRSSRLFKRVRDLERAKALRNADRRMERAVMNDEELKSDFSEEDAGFAESLLDAMLSNGRDPQLQRRNIRSPSSRQRSRSLAVPEQITSRTRPSNLVGRPDVEKKMGNETNASAPKVSKWTRVKAAFKWERACPNDVTETSETTPMTTPMTPTTKYLRIPEIGSGSWSVSPSVSEMSGATSPAGRISSISSSNEDVFDETRKNVSNHVERQTSRSREERRKDDVDQRSRSFDSDAVATNNNDVTERTSVEAIQGKPVIRIISENNSAVSPQSSNPPSNNVPEKEMSPATKRPPPTLTITIPMNEEEFRSVSSPESTSPLPSSTLDSGESSPQRAKMRQDASGAADFKSQRSTAEKMTTPTPKMQRQDSKWNKVRRAFLTNATFSVPPSPVRVIAGHTFLQDFQGSPRAHSCSGSVEDLDKSITTSSAQAETRRDYQALREKLGAEFHRKLVEWERLKSASPRVAARGSRDASNSGTTPIARDSLSLSEDRLTPEFKKKLQEWKRTKKGRRASASIERQRVSRRRLTDWQLWRSPSKPESRNQETIGLRSAYGSVGRSGSGTIDGRSRLCEDFVRKMEAWRRMNEIAYRGAETSKRNLSDRADGTSSLIDESEFLALERIFSICGEPSEKERREFDKRRADGFVGGDVRLANESQSVNSRSEVLIRTSVGSYRFEGISREFTRKLYDWEKYRGISPRSSTFRLLGPNYATFADSMDDATTTMSAVANEFSGEEEMFLGGMKRSKSLGSITEANIRDKMFIRRSTSLQSLTRLAEKLDDADRIDTSPAPNDSQRVEDASEDVTMDDSEPEAVIVDIEDVIEETASPLKRVQPHQTPVYSVAASETTSIAVPLGTVTSSHEPSPVILVEAEDESDREHWETRMWSQMDDYSSRLDNSSLDDHWDIAVGWNENSRKGRAECWGLFKETNGNDDESRGWNERTDCSIQDDDSVRSYHSAGSTEWIQSNCCDVADNSRTQSCCGTTRCEMIPESSGVTFDGGGVVKDNENKRECTESITSGAESREKIATKCRTSMMISDAIESTTEATVESTVESMDLPCGNRGGHDSETRERVNAEDQSSGDETTENANERPHDTGSSVPGITLYPYRLTPTQSITDYCNARTAPMGSSGNYTSHDDTNRSSTDNQNHAEDQEKPKADDNCDRRSSVESFDSHAYEELKLSDVEHRNVDVRTQKLPEESLSQFHSKRLSTSQPEEREQSRGFQNFSTMNSTSGSLAFCCESSIRTTPLTVSTYNETRCYERIIINEETLNKIVVPTATGSSESFSSKTQTDDEHRSFDRDEDREDKPSSNHVGTSSFEDEEVNVKKTTSDSTSKNVFVKTKRMIFSPFRRTEERPSTRKNSDESTSSLRPRSKSKSRSVSPKISRQDALLRMPLSLPWPLRSSSKDREVDTEPKTEDPVKQKSEDAERSTSENEKETQGCSTNAESKALEIEDTDKNDEKSKAIETSEPRVDSLIQMAEQKRPISGVEKSPLERNEGSSSIVQPEKDRNKCFSRRAAFVARSSHFSDAIAFSQSTNDENKIDDSTKREALPSDLMHKLRILSNAAATRDARSGGSPVESPSESRASRIRRAKESFLSRRGGPFCHSTGDPRALETSYRANRFVQNFQDSSETRMTGSSAPASPATFSNKEETEAAIKADKMTPGKDEASTTVIENLSSTTRETNLSSTSNDEAGTSRVHAEEPKDPSNEAISNSRSDLVKSASAGMINIDPNTFGRLATPNRGCESLPRAISKRRETSGPFARIVSKLKLSRLIRGGHCEGRGMRTISKLCRQSLLVEVQPDVEEHREGEAVEEERDEAVRVHDEVKEK